MFQYPENPQQPPKPLPTWGFLCQITCFLQTPHLTASSLLHKNSRGAGAESRPSLALPLSSVSALVHREPREEAEQEAEAIRSCSKLGGTGGGGRGAPPPSPRYEVHTAAGKAQGLDTILAELESRPSFYLPASGLGPDTRCTSAPTPVGWRREEGQRPAGLSPEGKEKTQGKTAHSVTGPQRTVPPS